MQCDICLFLKAARGNWRNAIRVKCDPCARSCPDILMSADRDAKPLLVSVDSLRSFLGEPIDPSECIGAISRQAFESLYAPWLLWEIDDPNGCSLRKLAKMDKQHMFYTSATRIGG